ncbi:Uncharacterized protein dnm_011350 [Desulfonema magnum]|uniref:Uncharacterized protein n=1 Tax=Desulfonema magnum TaxID=45655 RepID=A0A975BH12_9BACT|nr:Uncharacterized protein dnm_011350 [Desulfonema magnum]
MSLLTFSVDRKVFGLSRDRHGERGRNPAFSGGGVFCPGKKTRVSLPCRTQSGNFLIY